MTELTLDTAAVSDDWINPDTLSTFDREAICAALEAFFTPPPDEDDKRDYPHELSVLIKSLWGGNRLAYAVNAGDGSMFSEFDPAYCFGIEPEEKRSRKRLGRYNSIVSPLDQLSRLMEPINCTLGDTICVLRDGVDIDITLDFLSANLDTDTYVVYIDHGDANTERLSTHPGVYACIVLGSKEGDPDIRVWFATDPDDLKKTGPLNEETGEHGPPEVVVRHATVDTLDLLGPWLKEQYTAAVRGYISRYSSIRSSKDIAVMWKAIHREYGRRFVRADRTYDIELVGKSVINYSPSDWTKMAVMTSSGKLGDLSQRIHNRDVKYFAQHSGMWRELLIMEDEGVLLIEPRVIEAVNPIIEQAEKSTTPLRPLKPQERLGYLSRQSKIKCIKDDEEKGFVAGKYYSVHQRDEEYSRIFTKNEMVKKVLQLVKKKRRYYHQRIYVDGHVSFYDDDSNDIKYLLTHFDIPDPGNVRSRYPDLVQAEFDRYTEIEDEYLAPRGFAFKGYQKNDLAAISVNSRAILAHQQGLGKSIEGLAFAINAQKKTGKNLPVLLICPQDLIPQWQSEAKNKYGIDLHWIGRHKGQNGGGGVTVNTADGETNIAGGAIRNLIEARNIAKAVKAGEGGFYVTHFEALTMGGARNLTKLEEPYVIRLEKEQKFIEGGYHTDPETGLRTFVDSTYETVEREVTSAEECPKCGGQLFGRNYCGRKHRKHENDPKAKKCDWTRYTYRLPSIGKILSTAFARGVIIVDEGTQIASARNSTEANSSQKTLAVCGMRAAHRLVMSGTPVKNFIAQAFWLLWWGIGNQSERFPYAYNGGKKEFAKDYTVMEWTYNEQTHNWANVKEVGEVTNHTQLWAQLAAVLLRRTKEETGELIPKKETHVLHAPLGYYQREQMDFWLSNFPALFAEKYPDDPKVKRGSHVHMAPMLGLDVKLNYASVLPTTDPDYAWTTVPVSNYTPAAYRALTTIMSLVKQGRRVLVGTDIKSASGWLAAELGSKGVAARTMLKSNNSGDTLDPADRAKVVQEFQEGAMAVLCSTQKAIRLGHNLDKGSAVVLLGLDWDYETYAQFTERVHRLTSELPIDVYIIVSGEEGRTMLGRKWDVIQDKQKGAMMALDGHLPDQNEDPPDIASIVREMIEQGIPANGNEVMESKVKDAWDKVPHIDQYVVPEDFAHNQAKPWVIDWPAALAAYDQWEAEYQAAMEEWRLMQLPDPEGLKEFCQAMQESVDRGICEALEAFFAGATTPLPTEEVAVVTSTSGGEISPTTESAVTTAVDDSESSAGDKQGTAPVAPSPSPASDDQGQLVLVGDDVGSGNISAPADIHPAPVDHMGQLKQAKELLDIGVLDQAEFDDLKATLLAALKAAA